MSTVLVTGASRYLGARVARELCDASGVDRVIGLDGVEPRHPLGGAEFVRSDLRNPLLGRILARADVDVVLHLSLTEPRTSRERTATKEHNVIGTMQLLAAAQARAGVRRVVLKSTASVYGSSAKDPSHFTEDDEARGGRRGGYARDALDVEGYLRSAARRRPGLAACVLRPAHVVGPHVSSAMTDYLRSSFAPVPLGFDARLQVLHADDAVGALVAATTSDVTGTINVAAPGVVGLRRAVRLAGGTPVPVVVSTGRLLSGLARRVHLWEMPDEAIDHLMWGRALDTTRMRHDLGFHPLHTTREALADLGAAAPASPAHATLAAAAAAADGLAARLDPALVGTGAHAVRGHDGAEAGPRP
ncbi:NAD-dependent epimerase/dehydratase family protein [Agilicoccus flavus]|uniref:NAD-dependent epimerase/dehydratase family protein n=1 Tax=Agilicoccus flavus TaxID=2775968 RepID=UPI001CF6ACF7|nr:NAD-dependent epimerase/dehydratase family protein [Agilicoccus flavus]